MFESLGEKQRRTAMRGAFRAAASNVRAGAVKELRSSGLRSNRDVEKGIRVVVYKKALGFKVTVGTKKRRVNYGSKTGRELTEAPLGGGRNRRTPHHQKRQLLRHILETQRERETHRSDARIPVHGESQGNGITDGIGRPAEANGQLCRKNSFEIWRIIQIDCRAPDCRQVLPFTRRFRNRKPSHRESQGFFPLSRQRR